MKIRRWAVVFSLCAWSVAASADPVVLELAGTVVKGSFYEYDYMRPGEQIPRHEWEYASAFEGATTVTGFIAYDTDLPDTDLDASTGAYAPGTFSLSIPEIDLSISGSGSSVELHTYKRTPLLGNDGFAVYAYDVDDFAIWGGLSAPYSFFIDLFGEGNSPMLASDDLPAGPLDWKVAALTFNFIASDGHNRGFHLIFRPGSAPSPEPAGCPPPPTAGPPPTISSLDRAAQVVGQPIAITGTGFHSTPANNAVFFGTVRASIISASPTSLSVAVPAGAVFGPVSVVVDNLTAFSPAQFLPTFAATAPGIDATTLAEKVDFPIGTEPAGLAMGDLDGDGKPDLAVANHGFDTVSLLRNTSTMGVIDQTSFAPRVDFNTGSEPWDVAIGDLDGDGKPDLVDVQGLLLVVGGTLSAVLISYPLSEVVLWPPTLARTVVPPPDIARLRTGRQPTGEGERFRLQKRLQASAAITRAAGGYAMAGGWIGALLHALQLLSSASCDAWLERTGVVVVPVLYGAVLSCWVLRPLATKLEGQAQELTEASATPAVSPGET